MKDEELAEEFYYKTYPVTLNIGEEERKKEVIDIFLAGLKASKEPWHDLREDPYDVPLQEKNEKWHIVLDNFGNKCFYDNIINRWRRPETLDIIEPTAWCEVPTFEKE